MLAPFSKIAAASVTKFGSGSLGGRAGSLWYYRAVVDTLKSVDNRPIVAELERVVQELERLAASIPQSQDGPTPHPSP